MPAKARRCFVWTALLIFLAAGTARAQEDRRVSMEGHTWTGRVADAEGRPMAGVEIWVEPTAEERAGRAERRPVWVTEAEGLFTVPIARGTTIACPAGWLPVEHRPFSSHSGPPIELRLHRAARMTGHVVDEQGEPVPGADVTARLAGWSAEGCVIESPLPPCLGNPHYRSGHTDADGRFVFDGMKPGWFEIYATNGDRTTQTLRWQEAPGEGGPEVEIVVAGKLVPLEGRLVDADGKPVEGATVVVSGVRPLAPAQTDAAGAFRFSRVFAGPQQLQVSHPDLGWIENEVRIEGSPARLEVRMPRASLVHGRILGRDGSPVVRPLASVDFRHVEVDSEGRFRVHVPPGEHVLRVHARNWVTAEVPITATGDPMELNVELSRPGSVLGRVTGLLPGERGFIVLEDGPEKARDTYPGEDGSFQIHVLAPGTWTLVASDANGRTIERRVQVEEGRELTVEDLPFSPLPEVRGRVLDPDGIPVKDVKMSFHKGDLTVWALTDFKGRYKAHLVDGTWTVKAEMQYLGPATATLTMAGAPVEVPDLRLVRTATLSGYVRGLAPGEVPRLEVRSEDGLWTRESHAEQDFRFNIPNLWPGTWTLTAWVGERRTSTRVLILPGARTARADLAFEGE